MRSSDFSRVQLHCTLTLMLASHSLTSLAALALLSTASSTVVFSLEANQPKSDPLSSASVAKAPSTRVDDPEIFATLSNPILFTHDLKGTVHFYNRYFDYQQVGNVNEITSAKSREVVGAAQGSRALHATMVLAQHLEAFNAGDYSMVGLSIVALDPGPKDSLPRPEPGKEPTGAPAVRGEVGFALSVKGILRIVERMQHDGVPFVSPLTKSASGRSLHAAVLDPNGVRVEFYEILLAQ